ncbi:MAG TPA: sugar phosphate isomerase/epimerase family protein [Candidatus Saccharimonadales bacterium]
MKVHVSIGDFSPLLRSPEYLFKNLRQTGVDGIELCIGFKSRWTPSYYTRLSKKYDLPIVSVHQPLWAATGICFDAGSFKVAQQLGVQCVTCHPLPKVSLQSDQMRHYFERLADIQRQTGLRIAVENMPRQYRGGALSRIAPLNAGTSDVLGVCKALKPYGLGLTLDTDHVHVAKPYEESWFNEVFPAVKNIHLSSFDGDKRHLALDTGDLNTVGFIRRLKEKHYAGLITLEVSMSKGITMLGYDFDRIKRSVELCR